MPRYVIAFVLAVILIGCTNATPTPTPEPTASPPPPTETPRPTDTPEPTDEPTATEAPTPTDTPTPTDVPPPSPEPTKTDEEAGGTEAVPDPGSSPVVVTYSNHHYECEKQCKSSDNIPGGKAWAYRSFQVLMNIENQSTTLTIPGGAHYTEGWAPSRWIATDGVNEWEHTHFLQWVMFVEGYRQDWYERPDLPPGATSEWTWIMTPLPDGAWVKAIEYTDPLGNVLREDFPRPEGGQWNYVDCGDPRQGEC